MVLNSWFASGELLRQPLTSKELQVISEKNNLHLSPRKTITLLHYGSDQVEVLAVVILYVALVELTKFPVQFLRVYNALGQSLVGI